MLKKYPFVLQKDLRDCGVACLSMVIKYYKGNVSYEYLRELTKTTKKGTTAYHLQESAKTLGFHANGYKITMEDLTTKDIVFPCIAHVTINSYKHYVVLYERNIQKKSFIMADPASKVKMISFQEFEKIWTSFILLLYPSKRIVNMKENSKLQKDLVEFLKAYKVVLIELVILSFFIVLLGLIGSTFLQVLTDSVTKQVFGQQLIMLSLLYYCIFLFKNMTSFARNYLLTWLQQKFDYFLATGIFKNMILLPYSYYSNRTTGEVVSRMQDIMIVREVIGKLLLVLFLDIPFSMIIFLILYTIHPTLCFIIGVVFLIELSLFLLFQKIFYHKVKEIQKQRGEVTSFMVESLAGFESIQGTHLEAGIINKFQKQYYKYTKQEEHYINSYHLINLFETILHDGAICMIVAVGMKEVLNGTMTLGNVLLFYSLSAYFLEPIKKMIQFGEELKEAKNAYERVTSLFYEQKESGILTRPIEGTIVVQKLDFSFNDRDLVLSNISFTIEQGKKVAVMGASGSGKSTLFRLLMKYYKIPRGRILINGRDICDYTSKSIQSSICYITNHETLFTGSLYENIIMDSSDKDFFKVTQLCLVDEIIEQEPLGYRMLVSENGLNFSSGEKQRIALARTLLKQFQILIIDEGLSHLDSNKARKIIKNLFQEYKEKTIIVITHRKDNLDLFDQLLVLEKGTLKENECRNTGI